VYELIDHLAGLSSFYRFFFIVDVGDVDGPGVTIQDPLRSSWAFGVAVSVQSTVFVCILLSLKQERL